MIFSPITERSLRVRLLYLCIYALLSLGALSMVLPFVIMASGSLEPDNRGRGSAFFPAYLVNESALWSRYLQAKYKGRNELFRMSRGDANVDLYNPPPAGKDERRVKLWREFTASHPIPELQLATGFSDVRASSPYYNNRAFQQHLQEKYGIVEALNTALGTTYKRFQNVVPPNITLTGAGLRMTPLIESFIAFSASEVPMSRKFPWDAGGFYRAVFLPRVVGREIGDYNARYGTSFRGYAEVPFPAVAPEVGADVWTMFVTKLLRPNFVGLTEAGRAHFVQAGLSHRDFIAFAARPGDLRVETLDCRFAAWAMERHGVEGARIPQPELDALAFQSEKGFWKRVFFLQNYQYVLEAILLQGRAFGNTAILVLLMVGGTLLVNPLAAYALSRYKMPQTYMILLFFMATVAFPGEVTMIPVFLQLKEFNLLNTFGALVLPGLANGFSIFLLKGFFDSIPREMYEAAEIDGAGEWTMFWMVTMNLSKPILAVKALAAFVSAYGAFFYALVLAPDPGMWTIMVYVYQLQQSAGTSVVYASLILTAIPMLLVFIFCQNIILRGIVVPSEK